MKALMNRNLINLILGELNRAIKYKVLTIGIAVSLMWLLIVFVARKNTAEITMIVPLLIFTDAVLMSAMLIGAGIFFEKQEGSVRSLLISPVSVGQILISKIINAVIIALISALVVGIGALLMTNVRVNIPMLLIYVAITAAAHAAIGFSISMVSKDFNAMLINFMLFMFIFATPPILLMLGVIPERYDLLLLISPSQASSILLNSAMGSRTDWYKILISIPYLIVVAILLMRFFVYKRFKQDAMRG